MKVLKLVNDLGFGGTQRCAQNYALALKRAGLDVVVLAYSELGPREGELRRAGIEVGLIQDDVLAHVAKHQPDIIHIHREGHYAPKTTEMLVQIREKHQDLPIVETNVFSRADFSLPADVVDIHLQLSEWCLVKFNL